MILPGLGCDLIEIFASTASSTATGLFIVKPLSAVIKKEKKTVKLGIRHPRGKTRGENGRNIFLLRVASVAKRKCDL